jgi:hypothetical protein
MCLVALTNFAWTGAAMDKQTSGTAARANLNIFDFENRNYGSIVPKIGVLKARAISLYS